MIGFGFCCCEGCEILGDFNDVDRAAFESHYTATPDPSWERTAPQWPSGVHIVVKYSRSIYADDNIAYDIHTDPDSEITRRVYQFKFGEETNSPTITYDWKYRRDEPGEDLYCYDLTVSSTNDSLCQILYDECDDPPEGIAVLARRENVVYCFVGNGADSVYVGNTAINNDLKVHVEVTLEGSNIKLTTPWSTMYKPDKWWLLPEYLPKSELPADFPSGYEAGDSLTRPTNYDELSTAEKAKWDAVLTGEKEREGCEYPLPDCKYLQFPFKWDSGQRFTLGFEGFEPKETPNAGAPGGKVEYYRDFNLRRIKSRFPISGCTIGFGKAMYVEDVYDNPRTREINWSCRTMTYTYADDQTVTANESGTSDILLPGANVEEKWGAILSSSSVRAKEWGLNIYDDPDDPDNYAYISNLDGPGNAEAEYRVRIALADGKYDFNSVELELEGNAAAHEEYGENSKLRLTSGNDELFPELVAVITEYTEDKNYSVNLREDLCYNNDSYYLHPGGNNYCVSGTVTYNCNGAVSSEHIKTIELLLDKTDECAVIKYTNIDNVNVNGLNVPHGQIVVVEGSNDLAVTGDLEIDAADVNLPAAVGIKAELAAGYTCGGTELPPNCTQCDYGDNTPIGVNCNPQPLDNEKLSGTIRSGQSDNMILFPYPLAKDTPCINRAGSCYDQLDFQGVHDVYCYCLKMSPGHSDKLGYSGIVRLEFRQ